MAKIRLGPVVSDIKGSIGGTTFQQNASGLIARVRVTPARSSTIKQKRAHSEFYKFIKLWNTLTLDQKIVWNQFAKANPGADPFNGLKSITGFNYFIRLNYYRGLIALPHLDVPPVYSPPTAPPDFVIDLGADRMRVVFSTSHNTDDFPLVIFATRPVVRATTSVKQFLKFIKVVRSGFVASIDFKDEWEMAHLYTWDPSFYPSNSVIYVAVFSFSAEKGFPSVARWGSASVGTAFVLMTEDFQPLLTKDFQEIFY